MRVVTKGFNAIEGTVFIGPTRNMIQKVNPNSQNSMTSGAQLEED